MKKIAFLFPGQGSQSIGMGQELYQEYDIVRDIFDMAEDLAKINLSKLCFKGPIEDLTATINLQPALTAVNLSVMSVLEKENVIADITAGHSLGEYSALCLAKVLSREDTIRSVMKRGELMHRESNVYQGAMTAIIGLPIEAVQQILSKVRSQGVISIANHNLKEQIVITGSPSAVKKAADIASLKYGKAIPLKVSGAWHSQLIKGAESDFKVFLEGISFGKPYVSVVHNVTANCSENPDEIRSMMVAQLCSPVKWFDIMHKLMDERVEIFVEVGPGRVLSGLLKKTIPEKYSHKIYSVNTMKTLERFLTDIL